MSGHVTHHEMECGMAIMIQKASTRPQYNEQANDEQILRRVQSETKHHTRPVYSLVNDTQVVFFYCPDGKLQGGVAEQRVSVSSP